jgi:hypothetical protein
VGRGAEERTGTAGREREGTAVLPSLARLLAFRVSLLSLPCGLPLPVQAVRRRGALAQQIADSDTQGTQHTAHEKETRRAVPAGREASMGGATTAAFFGFFNFPAPAV